MYNMSINEIMAKIIKQRIKNNVSKIILFGSFAKGNTHKTSDIDIAVDGQFDYYNLQKDLNNIETITNN